MVFLSDEELVPLSLGVVVISLPFASLQMTPPLVASASCRVGSGGGDGEGGCLGGLMDRLRSMPPPSCGADVLSSSPLVSGEQLDRADSRWSWSWRWLLAAAVEVETPSGLCVLGSMPRARSLRLICVFQ
jgi:hypothetical protein